MYERTRLIKQKPLPNGTDGIHPKWELREATYSSGSTYIEARVKSRPWVAIRRTAIHGRPI